VEEAAHFIELRFDALKCYHDARIAGPCQGGKSWTAGDDPGLVLFLASIRSPRQRELRARLIASTGEGGYKIGYELASLRAWMLIVGFCRLSREGGSICLDPPKALKHVTVALMRAVILVGGRPTSGGRIFYTTLKASRCCRAVKLWAGRILVAWRSRARYLFGSFMGGRCRPHLA